MKKLLVVVVLLLVVSVVSFAATTTATATATVNAATGLSKTADLAIPNVNQGGTAQQLATDPGAAAFTVTGTANIPTTVTFGYPANLTNGGNNLPFTAQMPGYNALGTASIDSSRTNSFWSSRWWNCKFKVLSMERSTYGLVGK